MPTTETRLATKGTKAASPRVGARASLRPGASPPWATLVGDQAAMEAADPQSSPSRLAVLATSRSVRVRRLVAANPSSAFDTLLELGLDLPEIVEANPALPMHLLSDPSAVRRLPSKQAALVAASPLVSVVGQVLAEQGDDLTLSALAANPVTPVIVLAELLDRGDVEVLACLAHNPSLPEEFLGRLAFDPRVGARTPPPLKTVSHKLGEFHDPMLRALAASSAAPAGVLPLPAASVSAMSSHAILYEFLDNPRAPMAILRKLATDRSSHVRFRASRHPALPPDFLLLLRRAGADARLASHRGPVARLDPSERATLLAEGVWARKLLALQPELNLSEIRRLFVDEPEVRGELVANPRVPLALLKGFASDLDARVRAVAAQIPSLPSAVKRRLASDLDPLVRASLAICRHTPADLLRWLAADPEPQVRARVACNPRAPNGVLELLEADAHPDVRQAAADLLRYLYEGSLRLVHQAHRVLWELSLARRRRRARAKFVLQYA